MDSQYGFAAKRGPLQLYTSNGRFSILSLEYHELSEVEEALKDFVAYVYGDEISSGAVFVKKQSYSIAIFLYTYDSSCRIFKNTILCKNILCQFSCDIICIISDYFRPQVIQAQRRSVFGLCKMLYDNDRSPFLDHLSVLLGKEHASQTKI